MSLKLITRIHNKSNSLFRHVRQTHRVVLGWITRGTDDRHLTMPLYNSKNIKPLTIKPFTKLSDNLIKLTIGERSVNDSRGKNS
jgi:hypothetical protein